MSDQLTFPAGDGGALAGLDKARGDALTLEFSQASGKRADCGREPIEDSPLFGSRQGDLFE
jgi:hypothetical protein